MHEPSSGWKQRPPGSTRGGVGSSDQIVNFGERCWLTPRAQRLRQASRSRWVLSTPPLRWPSNAGRAALVEST